MRAHEFITQLASAIVQQMGQQPGPAAQPAQPPVVVNITNAAANAPEPQADDGTDPSENYDSEGNVIWTPPLQQMLDTVKSGANKNQPATGAITTVSQMPMG